MGARVFTTVREVNFEFARQMGADVLIDYQKQDYVEAILRETGGHGVDVVFDSIGGDTLSRSPEVLARPAAWSASSTSPSRRTSSRPGAGTRAITSSSPGRTAASSTS